MLIYKDFRGFYSINWNLSVDEEETRRYIKNYMNSELAEDSGWNADYLGKSLLAVYEEYEIDFADPQYMPGGTVGTILYLLMDENGEWTLWDYRTPWEIASYKGIAGA